MDTDVILVMSLAIAVGAGLGFALGRFAGGGWLLTFLLALGALAAGLMSDAVLSAFGVPEDYWEQLAYAAFAMLAVLPAMAGGLVAGGLGLWLAARGQRRTGEG